MKTTYALPALASGILLALCAQGAVLAQDAPPPPPMPGGEHAGAWREHAEQARAEHEHLLHDALALRSDQEPAWRVFVGAMKPEHLGARHERPDMGPRGEAGEHRLTTPERLDRMAARMAEHQAAFQRHAAAVKAFYAVLSPQQQHTFDALAKLGMDGHRGRMGHGHGLGGPGGRDD